MCPPAGRVACGGRRCSPTICVYSSTDDYNRSESLNKIKFLGELGVLAVILP